jgi:F-type H+-transporting ATPase subunit gamma
VSDRTSSLRRKIGSADDLRAVVRTMKALSASSIGQYERSVRALADYYRTVELGLGTCLREGDSTTLPSAGKAGSAEDGIGAVVFGSDQGLVGQFNEVVAEYAVETLKTLPGQPQVWAVGERVHARLVEADLPVAGLLAVPTSVQGITPLIGRILLETEALRERREIGELHLFYNRPKVEAVYAPVTQRLLPLDEAWHAHLADVPWPTKTRPEIMGSATGALRALIREYVFVSLFRACAESLASENASRLAAMERADRNIEELLESLHGTFHRVRQSSIDEELFDVIAGFEALSEDAGGASHRRKAVRDQ